MNQNILSTIEQIEDDYHDGSDDGSALCSNDFQSQIKQNADTKVHGPNRTIVVSRLSIWQTAHSYFKRMRFLKGSGLLQVTFATFECEEDAVDLGGPRREFFHLLLAAIARENGTITSMTYLLYVYTSFYLISFTASACTLSHAQQLAWTPLWNKTVLVPPLGSPNCIAACSNKSKK